MPQVKLTAHLGKFFPDTHRILQVDGSTIREIVTQLNLQCPGLGDYLVTEQGSLRQHVNIFVNGTMIKDRATLQDVVAAESEIYIVQALSGG